MASTVGTGHIAVLNEHFLDVLKAQNSAHGFTVWIMGGDAKLRLDLIEWLPDGMILGEFGTRLDDAADRVVRELLDLDEQVLSSEGDRLAWSASLIGDRSPYAGDLQLNVARYLFMDEVLSAGGRHLFFVEDELVAQALDETARANGLPVSRRGGEVKPPKAVETLRARASALKLHWRQSRILRKLRRQRPAPWGELAACDVVLVDWAGANSFNSDGHTDRWGNMVRMSDVLRKGGLKVGFIANPLSWTQPYEAIAENVVRSHDPVVLIDECRATGSVVRGALATWRLARHLKNAKVRAAGHNLSPLFDVERIKDKVLPQSTLAYSLVDVAMTLALNGVRPKAVVVPFENQGWERALAGGVRMHLPDTRLIAYQHAPFGARHIGFFPSSSDINRGRLADQLVVMGPRYEKLFQDHGWPRERLTLGGSLRFEPALNHPLQPTQADKKTILVATSIELDEALDLVAKAGAAMLTIAETRLVVNFHPLVDQAFRDGVRDALVQVVGKDGLERIEFSVERTIDLIGRADVMVYNSSGAVFDAYFAGVPAVHVAVDGRLSFDKVPRETSHRAYSDVDLNKMLNEILEKEQRSVPDLSIGGVIAPVDECATLGAVRGK